MAHHKDLTGTDLHEPKGVASASANSVYVSNGAGSGAWTSLSERVPPGTICDFMTPSTPSGWLELNGQTAAILTYPALYTAMTLQQSGTRTSGLRPVTGLTSTTDMRVGFYVFGSGIAAGTTISSVDSGTQITLSANASSSGTATVIVSPWLIDATNMTLSNLTDFGRYRRSRVSTLYQGVTQADSYKAHSHGFTTDLGGSHTHTGNTNSGGSHTHTGVTGDENTVHTHTQAIPSATTGQFVGPIGVNNGWGGNPANSGATGGQSVNHQHAFTTDAGGSHVHSFTTDASLNHQHTGTTNLDGSTEVRPYSIAVIVCVRT